MSEITDRAARTARHILPIKVAVRQPDGSVKVQVVDADVRTDKRTRGQVFRRGRVEVEHGPPPRWGTRELA